MLLCKTLHITLAILITNVYACEKEILVRKFSFFKTCVEHFLIIYEKVFSGTMTFEQLL